MNELKICLWCKYCNTVRTHPFCEDGDRFYCHIIDLFMTRSHAASLHCKYYSRGKQQKQLPVQAEEEE